MDLNGSVETVVILNGLGAKLSFSVTQISLWLIKPVALDDDVFVYLYLCICVFVLLYLCLSDTDLSLSHQTSFPWWWSMIGLILFDGNVDNHDDDDDDDDDDDRNDWWWWQWLICWTMFEQPLCNCVLPLQLPTLTERWSWLSSYWWSWLWSYSWSWWLPRWSWSSLHVQVGLHSQTPTHAQIKSVQFLAPLVVRGRR